jgi:hypothetical protein
MNRLSIIIIVVLVAACVAFYIRAEIYSARNDGLESIIAEKEDTIRTYKNKLGNEVASKRAAEASISVIKESYKKEIEDINKNFNVKIKNLEAYIEAETTSGGTIVTEIRDTVVVDTLYREYGYKRFTYRDEWISLNGLIAEGKVKIDWLAKDELKIIFYEKSNGFFGKKTLYVDATSLNPYTKIDNLKGIKVGERRVKRFGVGPYIGYGTKGLDFGLAVHYSVIKF